MSGLSHRIKQLDEELLALGEEAMLLEELDGIPANDRCWPNPEELERPLSRRYRCHSGRETHVMKSMRIVT